MDVPITPEVSERSHQEILLFTCDSSVGIYFRSFRAKCMYLLFYSVYQSCESFKGRVRTITREMLQPNIFVIAVNSIESTNLHCVGAPLALSLGPDLSYFNSPIYFGVLERGKDKGM